ncbi:heat shock protein 70 kDa, partial [Trifolium pratense]
MNPINGNVGVWQSRQLPRSTMASVQWSERATPQIQTFNPHCAIDQNFIAATLHNMACISSFLFTPLRLCNRPPPPHFAAATFHSIQLTPSHPFRLSALPLFTGNNNNGGGGGLWGNNPFDSDDFSSSSSEPASTAASCSENTEEESSEVMISTKMTEPAYTAASCTENTEEESSSLPPEITIGIDIGTWPCCISVWNGSEVELWKKNINEMMKRSCETSKDRDSSIGASSTEVSICLENEIKILYMKDFCSIVFGENASFPFLMHTVDIKVRPFVAAYVNKLWKSATVEELLGKFMIELRSMVETHLDKPIRNVVCTVPVSFSQLQLNWIHCACAMAGLKVIRLMPKPTAVALWYVVHQLTSSASNNESMKIALIFNMDAGYCDVSVIEAEKGKFRTKASTESSIGGEDLLGNMMSYLLPDFEEIFKR